MKKILFIDDDYEYQKLIGEFLVEEGYVVNYAANPQEGLALFTTNTYDLVISDLIMGETDGLEFVAQVRKQDIKTPIIILTGHINDEKELKGLDMHLNEYIYKLTPIEILLKKINRIIHKVPGQAVELKSDKEGILVDVQRRKVYKNGECILITKKEYELLVYLLSNKNIILSREDILKKVWRIDEELFELRTVDTHIKELRSKLDIFSINSVRGIGYEWFE